MLSTVYEIKALTQSNWEDMFSKKEVRKRIKRFLNENTDIVILIQEAEKALKDHYKAEYYNWYQQKMDAWDEVIHQDLFNTIVVDMFVLVTMNGYCNIQTVVGQMHNIIDNVPMMRSIQTLSEMLVVIADKTDLWNVYTPDSSVEGVIMVEANYELEENILQYLANTKYLPPMLVRPKMINCNYDYDYLNEPSSKILGSSNHHNDPIALDVLNIMNGIKLKIDTYMVEYDEKPNKELDTIEKVEQFQRMASASKEVYEMILQQGNEFYLTHKYDKRGRLYSQGYHINIQSTDYKKSLISLHRGETLNNF